MITSLLATKMVARFGRASTTPRTCMKVDLTKADNSVSSEALKIILGDLKFDGKAIDLIMDCVTISPFSILVEGTLMMYVPK